eukprot:1184271-Prorocentrum_minimum.AAC.1
MWRRGLGPCEEDAWDQPDSGSNYQRSEVHIYLNPGKEKFNTGNKYFPRSFSKGFSGRRAVTVNASSRKEVRRRSAAASSAAARCITSAVSSSALRARSAATSSATSSAPVPLGPPGPSSPQLPDSSQKPSPLRVAEDVAPPKCTLGDSMAAWGPRGRGSVALMRSRASLRLIASSGPSWFRGFKKPLTLYGFQDLGIRILGFKHAGLSKDQIGLVLTLRGPVVQLELGWLYRGPVV